MESLLNNLYFNYNLRRIVGQSSCNFGKKLSGAKVGASVVLPNKPQGAVLWLVHAKKIAIQNSS